MTLFSSLKPYREIRSEQPIEAIWGELLKLSDIFYLSHIWTYPNIEDTAYEYVSTSITQAHEYFKASKIASLQTRPLLLYYCFLNLTKATLFIKNNKKPSNYHGLCQCDNDFSGNLLEYKVKTNGGVFIELAQSVGCSIQSKQEFSVQDFCNNSIEINEHFSSYYKIEPMFILPRSLYIQSTQKNSYIAPLDYYKAGLSIHFDKQYAEIIKANTGILKDFKEYEYNEDTLYFTNYFSILHETDDSVAAQELIKKYFDTSVFPNKNNNLHLNFAEAFSIRYTNDRYYLNINPKNKRVHNTLTYFGLIFILGDIVRYKPDFVYKLLNDKKESNKWFITKVCDTIERVYPNLLLNMINQEEIKFSHY